VRGVPGERVLQLELRSRRSRLARRRHEIRGQARTQARPKDAHHQIALRGTVDLLLKTGVAVERLVFPDHERKIDAIGHLVPEPPKHDLRERPLLGHVAGEDRKILRTGKSAMTRSISIFALRGA